MPRTRKRHEQQELFRHGGKRPGAGRPRRGRRASEPHKRRPRLLASQPVHVVIRAVAGVASLRRRKLYRAIREATIVVTAREDFHIVHLSIQGTHVHLLCEATSRLHLARGMQVFQVSAARHINRALDRRGTVFPDRYHATIIKTPRQARHSLAYVLCNWRKHREDRAGFARPWKLDPFSSAITFDGWKERAGEAFGFRPPPTYEPLIVWLPRSWLLREGWRRHGLIGLDEVPRDMGARRIAQR